jgi:DNA-binding transcriptional LysR family regulator
MMTTTLHQLFHAETLARHGRFREAALELRITQPPALTRSIRALGGRLFERSGGGVAPTEAGERVMQTARLAMPAIKHPGLSSGRQRYIAVKYGKYRNSLYI